MQQKIWKWASLITIIVAITATFIPAIWKATKAEARVENTTPLNPAIAEHILQTSIQITMVEHEYEKKDGDVQTNATEQNETWREVTRYGRGMGTLVSQNGETLLISHDHWRLFTSGTAPDSVQFHDANGTLLHEMAGADLLPLILFHDSGTFILRAPIALATKVSETAKMGYFETLSQGDVVHVVHHASGQNDQVVLLAAEVVGDEMFNGVPVLSLRSLDGTSIEPGDSGGGIWVNGHLAGNLWMTVREVRQSWWPFGNPVRKETAFSLAAGLRVELIDLVETLLKVDTAPPALESGGLS